MKLFSLSFPTQRSHLGALNQGKVLKICILCLQIYAKFFFKYVVGTLGDSNEKVKSPKRHSFYFRALSREDRISFLLHLLSSFPSLNCIFVYHVIKIFLGRITMIDFKESFLNTSLFPLCLKGGNHTLL